MSCFNLFLQGFQAGLYNTMFIEFMFILFFTKLCLWSNL